MAFMKTGAWSCMQLGLRRIAVRKHVMAKKEETRRLVVEGNEGWMISKDGGLHHRSVVGW